MEQNDDLMNGYNADSSAETFDFNVEQPDYITATLNSKGIDRNSIKFEDESGDIIEKKFDDLSEVEKFNILNTPTDDNPMTNSEIDVINYMRSNGFNNMRDLEEYYKDRARAEFSAPTESYIVDDMQDEELMRFELENQYPDLSESEIDELMINEMSNPEIFQKKVNRLRESYQELELAYKEQEQLEAQRIKDEELYQMAGELSEVARTTDDIYGFELKDEEKEDILSFLLDKDANGRSEFIKLFDDPHATYTLAWFAKYGGDAISMLNDYWRAQITQSRDQNQTYRRQKNNKHTDNSDLGLDKYFK